MHRPAGSGACGIRDLRAVGGRRSCVAAGGPPGVEPPPVHAPAACHPPLDDRGVSGEPVREGRAPRRGARGLPVKHPRSLLAPCTGRGVPVVPRPDHLPGAAPDAPRHHPAARCRAPLRTTVGCVVRSRSLKVTSRRGALVSACTVPPRRHPRCTVARTRASAARRADVSVPRETRVNPESVTSEHRTPAGPLRLRSPERRPPAPPSSTAPSIARTAESVSLVLRGIAGRGRTCELPAAASHAPPLQYPPVHRRRARHWSPPSTAGEWPTPAPWPDPSAVGSATRRPRAVARHVSGPRSAASLPSIPSRSPQGARTSPIGLAGHGAPNLRRRLCDDCAPPPTHARPRHDPCDTRKEDCSSPLSTGGIPSRRRGGVGRMRRNRSARARSPTAAAPPAARHPARAPRPAPARRCRGVGVARRVSGIPERPRADLPPTGPRDGALRGTPSTVAHRRREPQIFGTPVPEWEPGAPS